MSESTEPTPAGVHTVVLAYAGFAALWILLSDSAMGLMFSDPDLLIRAGVIKGWLFVGVTSLLLYLMLQRLVNSLVSARQRAVDLERERHQPPPMLMAIAEASEDAIFAKDLDGRYLLCNRAAAGFIGKPAHSVVGLDDYALFPPDQAEYLMDVDRRVRKDGRAETREERLKTPLGERSFLSVKGPLRGADGKIFGTYGIARDVTALRREEQALRELADNLEATLQAIPDLLFEVGPDGRYLAARASNPSLLAAPTHQLIGRTVQEILPPKDATTVMDALAAAALQGTDYGRTIALALDGGLRHFELSVARKKVAPGEPDRFIVLSRDVTDRVNAELELRRRNEDLERFNRNATDRELRLVALKREVNAMAEAAGRAPPYDLAFADTQSPAALP